MTKEEVATKISSANRSGHNWCETCDTTTPIWYVYCHRCGKPFPLPELKKVFN